MVTITFHSNGVTITGHMNPVHCAELSALTWNCSNSQAKFDPLSKGDHTQNGYSYFAFDTDNKKSVFLFEEYKRNVQIWAQHMWDSNEYRFETTHDPLNLDELERVSV